MSSAPYRYTSQLPGGRSTSKSPQLLVVAVWRLPEPALTKSTRALERGLLSLRTTCPWMCESGPTTIRSSLTGGGGAAGAPCGCHDAGGIGGVLGAGAWIGCERG